MLRILLLGSACVLSSVLVAQNVGISNNAAAPDPSALLDLNVASGAKRGLLIPRMTEAQRLAIPTGAPENSLLVYQTDAGSGEDTTNARGFWYWDNNVPAWIPLGLGRMNWLLGGNTLTTVTAGNPEFLGTLGPFSGYTPNPNLVFRVGTGPLSDPPAMQLGYQVLDYQSGFVGLGTAAPATERLEVEGAIRVGQSDQLTPPREGTIRYGTIDGAPAQPWTGSAPNVPDPNLNWHWGSVVEKGTVKWRRLENAEELVTPPALYAKDTMLCVGGSGDAFRGHLSPEPVTQTTSTPANVYSPFATNYSTANEGNFRVQYLYRHQELVEAGLCFPAQITAIAFYCLDQENLTNDPPLVNAATTLTGEIRGGAPTIAGLQGPGAYYGLNHIPQYMDDGIRTKPVNGTFSNFTPSPGWMNFNLTTPINLAAGQNLIIDIVWSRSKGAGVGPRVELEDAGFSCTKWVIWPNSLGSPANRNALDDAGASPPASEPSGAQHTPTNINPHNWRPVTRFTGTVSTPAVKQAYANYLQYDGGIMVGDPAWAAAPGNFRGPGTVKAENGVYDGTLKLSDHVFDRYFDGNVRPGDEEATTGYVYTGLGRLRDQLENDRHLPNMPSRQEWEATGGVSLGKLATGLWESVEDQALYITQLEKDLGALEELTFGEELTPAEAERLINEVQQSRRLSEAQKMHLVGSIRAKVKTPNTEEK